MGPVRGFTLGALMVVVVAQAPTRARTPSQATVLADSVRQAARDSQWVRSERAYREILEKTNAQLSLWGNPYAIMVAALGVLFTIGAIAVGFIIFRQGSDYRNLIRESITEYQRIINAFIEEKNHQIEVLKQSVSDHIDRLTKENEKAEGERKKQIEGEIGELRRLQKELKELKPVEAPKPVWPTLTPAPFSAAAKANLGFVSLSGPTPSTSTLTALGRIFIRDETQHTCSKCGTTYQRPAARGLLDMVRRCPNCGHVGLRLISALPSSIQRTSREPS